MGNFGVCAARKYSTRKDSQNGERTRKKELKGPTGGAGEMMQTNKRKERAEKQEKDRRERSVCAAVVREGERRKRQSARSG
jgi:hypothetical protein